MLLLPRVWKPLENFSHGSAPTSSLIDHTGVLCLPHRRFLHAALQPYSAQVSLLSEHGFVLASQQTWHTGVGLSLILSIPSQPLLASRGTPPQLGFLWVTSWVLSYHWVLVRASLAAGYCCVTAQPWRVPLAQCLRWLGYYIHLGYAQHCSSQLQLKPAGTMAQARLAGTMTIMYLSPLTWAP